MAKKQSALPVSSSRLKQHHKVYNIILERIVSGQYPNGSKLPTQEEICVELDVSRPTVIHALNDLKAHRHIRAVQGSGSYVNSQTSNETRLGLIIPGIFHHEMDSVFFALQHQIMREASRLGWQVVLEDSVMVDQKDPSLKHPVEVARQLIKKGVKAAIFTPHEAGGRGEAFNTNVLAELAEANVAVVLLDRDIVNPPRRSSYDLVCMDNLYAGQSVGRHLSSIGAQRVVFIHGPQRFPSWAARLEGLRRGLERSQSKLPPKNVFSVSPDDSEAIKKMLRIARPDAVVCENDYAAAMFMKEILALGFKVPSDVMIASFDDAPIARLLPVTLTTVSQPVEALAFKAIETLRDRTERPDMPPVTVQVQCKLIVRESTRGKETGPAQAAKPAAIQSKSGQTLSKSRIHGPRTAHGAG